MFPKVLKKKTQPYQFCMILVGSGRNDQLISFLALGFSYLGTESVSSKYMAIFISAANYWLIPHRQKTEYWNMERKQGSQLDLSLNTGLFTNKLNSLEKVRFLICEMGILPSFLKNCPKNEVTYFHEEPSAVPGPFTATQDTLAPFLFLCPT